MISIWFWFRLPPQSALEMVVPAHAVGKVMGKSGTNIDNIRKVSLLFSLGIDILLLVNLPWKYFHSGCCRRISLVGLFVSNFFKDYSILNFAIEFWCFSCCNISFWVPYCYPDIWSSYWDFRVQNLSWWSSGIHIWNHRAEALCWKLDSGIHYGHLSYEILQFICDWGLN